MASSDLKSRLLTAMLLKPNIPNMLIFDACRTFNFNDVPQIISETLHIDNIDTLPTGEKATSGTDILIILGEDFVE